MGELTQAIKEKYFRGKKQDDADVRKKLETKNAIIAVCDKHLLEPGVIFTFEVAKNMLLFVPSVIEEEPLVSKYHIWQVGESLFSARLKELEMS